jgi:hypothetical protein
VERSSQQLAVDKKVIEVFREWNESGKPTEWTEMPVKKWIISTTYEEAAVKMLHKGESLHKKRLIVGNVTHRDGKSVIPFCVVARRTKVTGAPPQEEATDSASDSA